MPKLNSQVDKLGLLKGSPCSCLLSVKVVIFLKMLSVEGEIAPLGVMEGLDPLIPNGNERLLKELEVMPELNSLADVLGALK